MNFKSKMIFAHSSIHIKYYIHDEMRMRLLYFGKKNKELCR